MVVFDHRTFPRLDPGHRSESICGGVAAMGMLALRENSRCCPEHRGENVKPYKKMTPDPPSRRNLWLLAALLLLVLVANVVHQTL